MRLREIMQAKSYYSRERFRCATHLHILPSALLDLLNSEDGKYVYSLDFILGLKVVTMWEQPINAAGKDFFVNA